MMREVDWKLNDNESPPDDIVTQNHSLFAIYEICLRTGVNKLQGMHLFDNSPYWTRQRRELVQWLDERAPTFTEGYVGAVRLLHCPSFPARVHFICHFVRDIYQFLPPALGEISIPRPAEVIPGMVKDLSKLWKGSPPIEIKSYEGIKSDFVMQGQLHDSLARLFEKSRELEGTSNRIGQQLAIALYHSHDRREDEFIPPWIIKAFREEHKFFVKRTHFNREYTDEGLIEHFEAFERAFHSMVGPYFSGKEELDAILQDTNKNLNTPTKQQLTTAVQRMRSPEFAAYFLSRLENPHWVVPLKGQGLFDSPPPPTQVEGVGVTYPHWPASRYLARMGKYAPADVASIFASLETENGFVVDDMIDAALAMPANEAAKLAPAVSRAVQLGTLWGHFKDASDLCAQFASADMVSEAMTLAEALFTPEFEGGKREPSQHDTYWYKEGLRKVLPVLIARESHAFLARMCDWLKAMKDVDPIFSSDYSYMWRPAIEEHEQNPDYDLAASMVGFMRQGFEQAIRKELLSMQEALEIAGHYTQQIFRRIRIHLINEFAEQGPELARQIMMDRELFDRSDYKHEYAMLVGRRLDLLTIEERNEWFGWIDAGPDMVGFDERVKESLGRDAIEEDRQNRIRHWQFGKLHWVRKHLEGERRMFYEDMLAQHGVPEFADLNTSSGSTQWGDNSPMTVEALAELTFEQAVETVSSWESDDRRFMGPTRDGLAFTFGEYVAASAVKFSVSANALIGKPSIFVRRFIDQMAEAVKNGQDIHAHRVLELCESVFEEPTEGRTTPGNGEQEVHNKDLQWTRDEVSRFLRRICEAKANDIPKYPLDGLRDPIWKMISALCSDQASTYIIRDVSADDPRMHDYLNLGINSPRGQAMEAALAYAGWVANHINTKDGQEMEVPGGFDAMPEVREMLEWQIAPDNRKIEVLAVIGSRLSLIYLIDKDWLATNAGRLFFLEGITYSPPMTNGWAAWNAFLVWGRPHIELYRLFKEQFAYTVVQSTQVSPTERSREQPMYRLGEHLMVLYWRGELGFDDDEGLLMRFLSDTNPDIRRHAIGFVGQSLQGGEQIPEDIIRRFQELWEMYWGGAGQRDTEEKPDAWLFGAWFSSGQFPDQWALEQLENFVEVSPTPEPDHAIVEQLEKIAPSNIERVVRILDRMIRGDREGWSIHMWLDPATQILKLAMEAGGGAQRQAERVIDFLGRRGFTKFGEILELRSTTDSLDISP